MHGYSDHRLPSREDCVLRPLVDRWASETPNRVFVKFDDGGEWTYALLRKLVVKSGIGFEALGVERGDHVLSWLPNGPEALRVFFGLNYIGAVYVPINTAYKGRLLEHVIENSDAKVMVAHADLVGRLEEVDLAKLERVVVGGKPPALRGLEMLGFSVLDASDGALRPLSRPIEPWDTQSIIYTSGTTGPSKGVLSSYLHNYTSFGPESWAFIGPEDRFMINLPMFHIGGSFISYAMLCRGGSISMVRAFDTDTFWRSVRETESTAVFLLGVMGSFLTKCPPTAEDRDHPLRLAFLVPLSENSEEFSRRFGIDVYTLFNMTEISTPVISEANPKKAGSCGKARTGVEVRLVDENDCEVPVGEVGEMIVRTDRPWAMNHGYYKNAEATVGAWRNGWFHTGDAFRKDAEGSFYFVDRTKDAIRRRGENISSFELETEVTAHPGIREAAAIPVPSELGEDDVMVVVAPAPGATVEPAALLEFLEARMAYFMVPRYVRVLPELPKTPTAKVLKHVLREAGITEDTWDREAEGVRVKRERVGRPRISG